MDLATARLALELQLDDVNAALKALPAAATSEVAAY